MTQPTFKVTFVWPSKEWARKGSAYAFISPEIWHRVPFIDLSRFLKEDAVNSPGVVAAVRRHLLSEAKGIP